MIRDFRLSDLAPMLLDKLGRVEEKTLVRGATGAAPLLQEVPRLNEACALELARRRALDT